MEESKLRLGEYNMTYNYYTSSSPAYIVSPGDSFINDFQNFINDQFYNAPDAHMIQEESVIGSAIYSDIDVRVNSAINQYTGEKLGDDWKAIIFKDLSHAAIVGTKYFFDDNYWLTINSEIIKNFAAGATLRRANGVLRWVNADGIRYSEPCCLEYTLNRPKDQASNNALFQIEGYTKIYCQANVRTKSIKPYQRFLFGPPENRVCLRIFGGGLRNYLNQKTLDDTSSTLLELEVGIYQINPDVDDIINGYANAYLDYNTQTSGSNIGALALIATPNITQILSSSSQIIDAHYYSGSDILSGSVVFSVANANVPSTKYAFAQETPNTFSIYNISPYFYASLDILCSGSSGSRILSYELRGRW